MRPLLCALLAALALGAQLASGNEPRLASIWPWDSGRNIMKIDAVEQSPTRAARPPLIPLVRHHGKWVRVDKARSQAKKAAALTGAAKKCPYCNNKKQLAAPSAGSWKRWPQISVALVEITLSEMYAAKCTGTLIRPNRILTAGHCVIEDQDFFTSGTVSFGAYGTKVYGPKVAIKSVRYFSDWADKGLYRADFAVLHLAKNVTGIPVANIAVGSTLTKGSTRRRRLTNLGYPFFLNDNFYVNNLRQGFAETPGYKVRDGGTWCGGGPTTVGMYFFGLPIGNGMSGGPVFDVVGRKLVATNDLACSNLDCDFDFACTRGYSPITTHYSVNRLCLK